MRKSALLIVAVIFLASVIVMGLFGMAFTSYKENIYAESIVILDQDGNVIPENKIIYVDSGTTEYTFKVRVYPTDTTNKNVSFSLKTNYDGASISDDGVITFTEERLTSIIVTTSDGSNIKETFHILFR